MTTETVSTTKCDRGDGEINVAERYVTVYDNNLGIKLDFHDYECMSVWAYQRLPQNVRDQQAANDYERVQDQINAAVELALLTATVQTKPVIDDVPADATPADVPVIDAVIPVADPAPVDTVSTAGAEANDATITTTEAPSA